MLYGPAGNRQNLLESSHEQGSFRVRERGGKLGVIFARRAEIDVKGDRRRARQFEIFKNFCLGSGLID
jgi:predicted NUDIX family NTP pyrophosphohydrolase